MTARERRAAIVRVFVKKTQKAPKQELELAEKRLGDWRARRKKRK